MYKSILLALVLCLIVQINAQTCKTTEKVSASTKSFTDGSKETEQYTNNLDKCWELPASKMTLTFTRLSVEKGYDYVQVFEGSKLLDDDVQPGDSFTGSNLKVWFHTDESVTDLGFTATVSAAGGDTSGPTQVKYNLVKTAENCKNVNKYRTSGHAVVRRGCSLYFSATSPVEEVELTLISPSSSTGTIKTPRGLKLHKDGQDYRLEVPADAPVGGFTSHFVSGGKKVKGPADVYIVFNPFLSGNPEHCPSEQANYEEYLMRESGAIWVGSTDNNGPKPWIFNQFDETILRVTANHVLDKLTLTERADPALVARRLTNRLSGSNPGGVLIGRWDGKYTDGDSPSSWTGSLEIFQKFERTGAPVKYGQCWVFSGITNSASRSLGLVTRPVTNFESAHENPPFDGKIEQYWKKQGNEYIQERATGSIWNFHVWNEVCIARPDLKISKAEWNAFDATPQERSGGAYQTGPAVLSLMKAKKFTADTKYDHAFIASETNADVVLYVDGKYLRTDTNQIGPFTYTRRPAADSRHSPLDVAPLYKTESGSFLETDMLLGNSSSKDAKPSSHKLDGVLQPKLFIPKSAIRVGEDVVVKLQVKKPKTEIPDCNLSVKGYACDYTTDAVKKLLNSAKVALKDLKDGELQLVAEGVRTYKYLREGASTLCVEASITCPKENYVWVQTGRKLYEVPRLNMLGRKFELKVGHTINFNVFFTNPLGIDLTNPKVRFSIDGSGFDDKVNIKQIPPIEPNKRIAFNIQGKCSSPGLHIVSVTLDTRELFDIYGYAEVMCHPREPTQKQTNSQLLTTNKDGKKKK